MDVKRDWRKSRRRSVRFLKSVKLSDDDEVGTNVYGSVWLSENDKDESACHSESDKIPSDCPRESEKIQSPQQNTCEKLQSRSISENEVTEIEKLHSHCDSETVESEKRQTYYHSDSENIKLQCNSESGKLKSICPSENNELQSHCHHECDALKSNYKDSETQQFHYLNETEELQSHQNESDECQSDLGQGQNESEKLQSSCCSKSEKIPAPSQSDQNQSYWPCRSEMILASGHKESDELQSHGNKESDNKSVLCYNKHDQVPSRCTNEKDQFWSLCCHDTPEGMRSAQSGVDTSSVWNISQNEITHISTADEVQCASDTPQTFHSDSENRWKIACITPTSNELECERDETSLNQGFVQFEESPCFLENSTDGSPVETPRLQMEDPVFSSADLDVHARIQVDQTVCSSMLQSIERLAASSSNTPVRTSSDTASQSESVSATVQVPLCSSAKRLDYEVTTVSAVPATISVGVSPHQRHSTDKFHSVSVNRINSSYADWSAADNAEEELQEVKALPNTRKSASETLVTDNSDAVTLTDRTESGVMCAQDASVDANYSEAKTVGISQINSFHTALSTDVYSQGIASPGFHSVVSSETPDTDNSDLTADGICMIGSNATVSKPTETVSDGADTSVTSMVPSTEILPKDLLESSKPLNSTSPQFSQFVFHGHKQNENSSDSKKIRKKRRRSAFGAELKLDKFIRQNAAALSLQTVSTEESSAQHVLLDSPSSHSRSVGTVCAHDEEEDTVQTQTEVSQIADKREDNLSGSEMPCDQGHREKEEPTLPASARRKRRSAGTSHKATRRSSSSSQDTSDFGQTGSETDTDNSLFTKRRSSLRLYRQQCQRPMIPPATADESGADRTQPEEEETAELSLSTHQPGASAVCEESEPDWNIIPYELAQLYRNKNYKRPADKTWETIYESPSKGRVTSKQKLRRYIQFEDHAPVSKLKRRSKKAAQNGWNIYVKKSNTCEQDVMKKLEELDKEISLADN